jgi:hypothetical protein
VKKFNVRLFDPPKAFTDPNRDASGHVMRSVPVAALFATTGAPSEICRVYGYLMLLGQNLEFELRECLISIEFSLALRGIKPRFFGKPEKATFEKLIDMFAAQLNTKHPPTKEFVDDLHRARKLRNRLAHGFLHPSQGDYFITHGGQQAMLHRLKLAEKIFFPVVMFVGRIGRGYAADLGVTAEFVERQRKLQETEQREIEADLKDIFDDEDLDNV